MRVLTVLLAPVACLWSADRFAKSADVVASRLLTVPKPRAMPCEGFGLGAGGCFVFSTASRDASYISPLRALYLLEGSFEGAAAAMAQDFGTIRVVMKADPRCRLLRAQAESLGSPQIGGLISITEESAKQSEKGWDTSATVSYSTPGAAIAGVTVTLSAEYHKSIVSSTSTAVGQIFDIPDDASCEPTILRHSVVCDPVSKLFLFQSDLGDFSIPQSKGNASVLLPLTAHSPKFFSSAVGCIRK